MLAGPQLLTSEAKPAAQQSLTDFCVSIFWPSGPLRPFGEVFARSMAVVDNKLARRYKRLPDFMRDWADKANLEYL
ncbi:MAG TPA: hypothetical protein PLO23_11540 [Alphaproteobacteria bacterium]|nr:hypothetical protein [Alphaproteobacteria bacterium]